MATNPATTTTEKVKNITFVCKKYEDLKVMTPSGLISFELGKYTTSDKDVIDAIKNCSSFEDGIITIKSGKEDEGEGKAE